jgi:hypothetical protein
MKQKVAQENRLIGHVNFFEDPEKNFFMAVPHGNINPSLLKEDLERARSFANKVNTEWTYITNTEHVGLVNPFNLIYLKEVKRIKNIKRIVIYAPHFIHRVLIKTAWFIVRPDLILKNSQEFEKFMKSVH